MASLQGRALDVTLLNDALRSLEQAKDTLRTLNEEPGTLTEAELDAVRKTLGKVLPAIGLLKRGIDDEILSNATR